MWGLRITQEFIAQGEQELALGLPVAPTNSKDQLPLCKTQVCVNVLSMMLPPPLNLPAARLYPAYGHASVSRHVSVWACYIPRAARQRYRKHEIVVGNLRQCDFGTSKKEKQMSARCCI
jgi:hypothetical protein